MVIREATGQDWLAIWPILEEVGTAGETLTWDPARTEARARAGWMRELPGRTIVAVDDDGRVIGSANTYLMHPGPGAHVANAGFVVHPARRGEGAVPPCPRRGTRRWLPGHAVQCGRRNQYCGNSVVALLRLSDSCYRARGVSPPGARIRWTPYHVQKAVKGNLSHSAGAGRLAAAPMPPDLRAARLSPARYSPRAERRECARA
jgi:acetyltransferase (GNAT) family protein